MHLPTEQKLVVREDGSMLVSGWMPVDEFAERFKIKLQEDRDYETAAGPIIEEMGQLPKVGDSLEIGEWRIEVVDLDGRRINKLLIQAWQAPH
jgi:putative hemolysin